MNDEMIKLLSDVSRGILFGKKYNHCDILELLNWAEDHGSAKVYRHKNGFLELCYCGRCSNIVGNGDKYCSQCGRALRWE